ncbi:hypothetical protein MAPG_11502 [Magnaporthiopsis poae ATCC 64411]|uniref:Serine hydrolase domain-containing protein n=1 Tax=Magnaporthiopsis poae (strain ATCC 64411 / 73-15) TaxID=644358 RepID=A0A0C4EFF8_MAGP6|nr:hypothetical protein MAPG_11502 [Magnaporthiopsis poae ATCC 64411]
MPHTTSAQACDLPRILCLHGGGTNARIFRTQCRVITSRLRGLVRLVFAEAPLPSTPGPDVTSVYASWGPFRAWLPPSFIDGVPEGQSGALALAVVENTLEATMREDDAAGNTGPWIGVLGFSQGAKLAASLLLRQQQLKEAGLAPGLKFRFGVLLAGRGPLIAPSIAKTTQDMQEDDWGASWEERTSAGGSLVFGISVADDDALQDEKWPKPTPLPQRPDQRLSVPTLHVHGVKDPGLHLHRRMMNDWCDASSTTLMQWDGDHRVPIRAEHVVQIVDYIKSFLGA